MKKSIVVFGVILVFIGVVVASASNQTIEKYPRYETVGTAAYPWEVWGNFKKGDELVVIFVPPPDPWPGIPVVVEIWPEEDYDNKTVFQVEYEYVLGRLTANISVVSEGGGLIVEDFLQDIGGVVTYNGYYWANITEPRLPYWDPPPKPELMVEIVDKERPYLFALPIGVGIIVVGGFFFLWGVKSSKRRPRYEGKK